MPGENLTRIEAQERRAIVDTHSYEVALDLTKGDEVFGSRTVVRFTATEGADTFIDLIARDVRSITLNGRDVPVTAFADSRIALTGLERRERARSSRRTACTRTRARACTASSTPSTARSTSTRSSRCPTPAASSPCSSSPT